jgi:hypothetical protein
MTIPMRLTSPAMPLCDPVMLVSCPLRSIAIVLSVNAWPVWTPTDTRKTSATATYARSTQRQRPGGTRPSGKSMIGSGSRSRIEIHASGARATASRESGSPSWSTWYALTA